LVIPLGERRRNAGEKNLESMSFYSLGIENGRKTVSADD
jgi:hypothetical protein